MKTTPSPALLAALLVSAFALAPASSAFTEIARGSLTLTTTASVAYDSNIAGNAVAQGDTIFTLAPTLDYNRAAGLGTIAASVGTSINRYLDLPSYDSEDLAAALHISLPTPEGARHQGGLSAGYTDRAAIDETLGQRIRAKTWNAGFNGTYRVGTRVDLRSSASYLDTTRQTGADTTRYGAGLGFDYNGFLGGFGLMGDYKYSSTTSSAAGTAGPIDQTSNALSTGLFYRFVSGLRAAGNVGYRWIDRSSLETATGATSSTGMTYGLSLDGPFLPPRLFPKIKSSFSIGYEKGETLGVGDTGSANVVGSLNLSWQARERTSLTFGASRAQSLASNNYSAVTDQVQFGVTQQIGQRTSLRASLAEEWSSYVGTGRSDRHTRGAINLAYNLNRNWRTGAGYTITLARSNGAIRDYDRHLVSAFVSCTY